jgi:hypothetical protein
MSGEEDIEDDGKVTEAEMLRKLLEKMHDLEATWVGYVATPGREDDADFISTQIKELQSFVEHHSSCLGANMMESSTNFGLLSLLSSDTIFYDTLLPMLKAKAQRDGCTVETVFRELTCWAKTNMETSNLLMEELLLKICDEEQAVHNEFLSANNDKEQGSRNNKKQLTKTQSEIESTRATQFKPIILAYDSEARSANAAIKRSAKRHEKLTNARKNKPGWLEDNNKSSTEQQQADSTEHHGN